MFLPSILQPSLQSKYLAPAISQLLRIRFATFRLRNFIEPKWMLTYEFHDGLRRLDDGLIVPVGFDSGLVVLGVLVDSFLND